MRNYWILEVSEDACGCTIFDDIVDVLLDPRHEVMVWEWTGRCKDTQHMELEIQRQGKAEKVARRFATTYTNDHRRYTHKEEAAAVWKRKVMVTQLESLCSYLLTQKGKICNKTRIHMGLLNCEVLARLVCITSVSCFISLHIIISVLSIILNINNRDYVLVNIYFYHLVRPPDILFFELYI